MYSELFVNGKRQILARYPNEGYLHTDSIISSGKLLENKSNGDPAGDIFLVNDALTSKITSWRDLEKAGRY